MGNPQQHYIVWAPHYPRGFVAKSPVEAKRIAREWINARYSDRPRWPTLQRQGWRISKVGEDVDA